MHRRGFWGLGSRGVSTGAALLVAWALARSAAAQSTASFPEPAGPGSARTPNPAPPTASAPAPSVVPPPSADSTTDSRYPTLPSVPRALPETAGSAFYPALLPYREGLPVPPGYQVEHRSANGFIVGGLATLGVAYGTAFIVAASADFKDGTGWLVLPVIGPWAAIGARSYQCDNDPLHANACVSGAFNEVQTIAILSADAVVQATGAVLFLAGLASGRDELVRSDLQTSVRVTPRALGASGFGLGFDGRF